MACMQYVKYKNKHKNTLVLWIAKTENNPVTDFNPYDNMLNIFPFEHNMTVIVGHLGIVIIS